MQPFKLLPNELLYSIIEYIAYTPILPALPFQPDSSSKPLFNCASHELLALSVLEWRLRRICLPFLFKNIEVRNAEDAEKMKDYLLLFARFTQTLAIGPFDALTVQGDKAISQILPQLEQLSYVELQQSSSRDRTILLRKLLAHPTVISVLVRDLPDESICDEDLSKLVLKRISWSLCPSKYFKRGMKLLRLNIFQTFNSQLIESEMLSGLKELRITMSNAVSSSFLSALLSTYPTLEELWLVDYFGHHFDAHTPPCISPSIEKSQWPCLNEQELIQRIGLRRVIGHSSDEWYVMGLAMEVSPSYANRPLLAALRVIASSFPTVENVTLYFAPIGYNVKDYAHAKDFATVFSHFPSLKQLSINHLHTRLDFGSAEILPPIRRIGFNALFDEEFRVLWYTAWIAKEIRSLHAIYIMDNGCHINTSWHLEGWLHVMNSNRDIGGTFRRLEGNFQYDDVEVLLEPSMLSSI
ncbi:hypothetical protein FB446DRAFT_26614 [Lentinula raphanica]|nr:hypothetical protein FB446DRAFT_26614 [Lentinula raphanica]